MTETSISQFSRTVWTSSVFVRGMNLWHVGTESFWHLWKDILERPDLTVWFALLKLLTKLSNVNPVQYLDGWPPEKLIRGVDKLVLSGCFSPTPSNESINWGLVWVHRYQKYHAWTLKILTLISVSEVGLTPNRYPPFDICLLIFKK